MLFVCMDMRATPWTFCMTWHDLFWVVFVLCGAHVLYFRVDCMMEPLLLLCDYFYYCYCYLKCKKQIIICYTFFIRTFYSYIQKMNESHTISSLTDILLCLEMKFNLKLNRFWWVIDRVTPFFPLHYPFYSHKTTIKMQDEYKHFQVLQFFFVFSNLKWVHCLMQIGGNLSLSVAKGKREHYACIASKKFFNVFWCLFVLQATQIMCVFVCS